ncbi:hypothetical protein KUTeg_013584 [Tegillarca granosa]|uniref:Sodium/calcium exchanger membrane region domain-containing protein n=1 Tax=Tegillarca granosa TaxID=220873 RepID=A0ABQ9EY04_TEGGR|nr:hypothetical protein KUTeg_013584 [Tegillarca granosa]
MFITTGNGNKSIDEKSTKSYVSTSSSTSVVITSAIDTFTTSMVDIMTSNYTNSSIIEHNITIIEPDHICTSPAYHEFPPDAFTNEQRAHGAIVLHFILVIYMFIALAIVCDDYFVASLDKICQKLGFSEDVAGATFMAAGSSAPELFTAIIGVFITKGDVGVGTIVGSAVFNILFVIGLCALLAGEVVVDGTVTWYESLIMLILYAGYIVVMRFNTTLQVFVTNQFEKLSSSAMLQMNGAKKMFQGDYEVFNDDDDDVFVQSDYSASKPCQPDEYAKSTQIKPHFTDFIFRLMMMKNFKPKTRFRSAAFLIVSYKKKMLLDTAYQKRQQFRKMAQKSSVISYTRCIRGWFTLTMEGEDWDFWRKVPSVEDGYLNFLKWGLMYPLHAVLYYTVPDCRKPRWERWFMATFILSIVWIAIFSYIMVWMVTYIGFTFNIPDSVMGITFLAAGTSIPDAMASVLVAREGMGDMAVSNSLGSNVFDILLGLSLPWFLKTGVAYAGTTVHINSHGMIFSIILLFLTVLVLLGTIRYTGWLLTRKLGYFFLSVYAVYLTISVMIECNVFGFVNPPMCET